MRKKSKQLLRNFWEKRGYSNLEKEALDRSVRRTRFGGDYGPVVRQTTEWMNEWSMRSCSTSHIH